jgi:AraC family transcriptional regulator, transcriptional activator of pobA
MPKADSHIPFLKTIHDFFSVYGLGKPLHPEIMCMKLEDQPDERPMHMPLCRANFFRVIHFTNANLKFASADKTHDVFKNCLCFTYPGKLESWIRTGRLYGYVTYFTPLFAGLDITHNNFDHDYPFFNFNAEPVLALTEKEADEIKQLTDEMIKEIYSDSADKLELIRKLLLIYLHKIKRIYHSKVNSLPPEIKETKSLFNRFRKEVDDHMQQLSVQKKIAMPAVSIIAKKLFVNANYLNSIVKKLTGKTASAHIQEKLLLEAKSFLIHTDLQVNEIAFRLGFENTSYFNRFFRKNTSRPPAAYRKQFVKR